MHSLLQDVQFSLKLMRKRPGMTLLVIAALVLGMSLNTAIFSVVNAVLLRPLPIFEPDRVVWLHSRINPTGAQLGTSYPEFLDWRTQSRSFDGMAAMYFFSVTLSGQGPPEHLKVIGISASGWKVWGIFTVLGREFRDIEDQPGAGRVVILGYRFWQSKFGGDPGVLEKTLVLDDQQYTIVGVLQPTQIKVLTSDIYVTNGPLLNAHLMERDSRWFFPVGRLKHRVSLQQAQAEMQTIGSRLAAQYPDTTKDMGIRVESMTENLTAADRKPLLLLIIASSLIFLLAALNVLTVFISGAVERAKELSVMVALGSPRSRLLRQFFVHAVLFATLGGALGLLAAKLGLTYFLHRFPDAALRFHETNIDLRVVAVTLVMVFGTTLVAAIPPAIYSSRLNLSNQLRGEWSSFAPTKYRTFWRGALILTEVALASGLSLVSGLLIKSFYRVEQVDLGFDSRRVFSFQITPPLPRYKEPEKQTALYKTATERLASLPGMVAVSGISSLPLTFQALVNSFDIDAQSALFGHEQQLLAEDESILPGFFQVMGISLLQGRDFTAADHESAPPVVIVDDVLAAKLWPGQNPLGKRVYMSMMRGNPVRWLEVVGVVREIKHFGPERKVRWMQIYVPEYQDPSPTLSFVLNTTLPAAAAKNAAEKALHDVDKDLPVEEFGTMDSYLDTFLSSRRAGLLLLSAFAAIGIVLGMIGIFGVVANSVTQRRRDIAVRMALGARRSRIILLITRTGLLATVVGLAIGFTIVLSLTRILSSLLFGVSPLDGGTYVVSAIILIILAVTASVIPAMRLFHFNIQEILRQ